MFVPGHGLLSTSSKAQPPWPNTEPRLGAGGAEFKPPIAKRSKCCIVCTYVQLLLATPIFISRNDGEFNLRTLQSVTGVLESQWCSD